MVRRLECSPKHNTENRRNRILTYLNTTLKQTESKTSSYNLQNKQANQFSFKRDGEATFFSEGAQYVQTKPFFSSDNHHIFAYHKSEIPFYSPASIQPKLTIGQPNDRNEQEADTMADKVAQKLDQPGSRLNIQTKCDQCAEEEKSQEKSLFKSDAEAEVQKQAEEIRTKSKTTRTSASPNSKNQLSSSKGRGNPLPDDTLRSMESSFGTDFSTVRIHTDTSAVEMNKGLGAQAFTNGSDIYFNKGKYNPKSTSGKHLLAHELTHVVQQSHATKNIDNTMPAYESNSTTLQRQPETDAGTDIPSNSTTDPGRTFDFTTQTQSFGRFDGTYTPVGPAPQVGRLDIEIRVHFTFRGRFSDEERSEYIQNFESSVETAWSEKHELVLNDPDMDRHRSTVHIDVVSVEDPDNAHYRAIVARRRNNFRSKVEGTRVELDDEDATNSDTNQVTRADKFKQVGDFYFDSADLNPDVEADLVEIETFLNDVPEAVRDGDDPIFIEYTGRASSEGSRAYNRQLSERRLTTVQNHINARVTPLTAVEIPSVQGEENTERDSKYRRVDVKIDLPTTDEPESTTQNTAAHEAGHMFGLGDEYIEEERPDHRFEGDHQAFHNTVRDRIGEDAAEEMLVGNNESIMSHGMNVLRGHYIPFIAAILRITGNDNWNVE